MANLRQADIILGGHGAPIMPAVEHIIHKPESYTAYLNIGMLKLSLLRSFYYLSVIKQLHPKQIFSKISGGISNINIPPSDESGALGFDIGPGNCLLDLAVHQLFNLGFRDFFTYQ